MLEQRQREEAKERLETGAKIQYKVNYYLLYLNEVNNILQVWEICIVSPKDFYWKPENILYILSFISDHDFLSLDQKSGQNSMNE
mgnify:CR=1 FL=1